MTINVGDEVYVKREDGSWSDLKHTVLYIHQRNTNRKWYVVAYLGDIPTSYYEHQLKKDLEKTTERFVFGDKWFYVDCVDDKPDWSTVR